MADKSIGLLPAATELDANSLMVTEQQGISKKVTGELVAQYAREATESYANDAKAQADKAKQEADRAKGYADTIEIDHDYIEQARTDAQTSATEAAGSAAAALKSQQAASQSEKNAASSETKAKASQDAALASQTAAASSASQAAKSETNAAASAKTATDKASAASTSATNAASSASQAATSASNAADSEEAAAASQTAAKASENAAKSSQTEAAKSATAAAASQTAAANSASAAATSATEASESKTAAASSASAAATSASNASKSETAAKSSQTAAANSATAASGSAGTAKTHADAAKTSADAAKTSETNAEKSATEAKDAATLAQSIAQGQKGYYDTPDKLRTANPSGESGDWAIVGSTDTIWVWDSDTSAWKDSHQATDLSNYYTKAQTDTKLAAKQDKLVDSAYVKSVNSRTGAVVISKDDVGLSNVDNTHDSAKNVLSATKLTTARQLGVNLARTAASTFDGTANQLEIPVKGVLPVENGGTGNATGKAPTAGAADTAAKLATPRNINGIAFDGSKDITVYDSTKVAKTGDTMTGDLTLSGASRAIKYASGTRTNAPISFYAGDVNGSGIVIGDGGRTIIGGGESAQSLRTALGTGTTKESAEEMHVASDGSIFLHTNCQTIDSRKTVTINGSGNVSAPGGFSGSLSGKATSAGTADKVGHSLKFTGGSTANFDGSADQTVAIPKTAADVGAVAKTGDIVTGALTIRHDDASLSLIDPRSGDDGLRLHVWGSSKGNNTFSVYSSTKDNHIFQLQEADNGAIFSGDVQARNFTAGGNAAVQAGDKAKLYTDGEGGNLNIISKDGQSEWEMDAEGGHLRIYHRDRSTQSLSFPFNIFPDRVEGAGLQPALGFIPVRQGQGVNGMYGNTVTLGWGNVGTGALKLTVDYTDFGAVLVGHNTVNVGIGTFEAVANQKVSAKIRYPIMPSNNVHVYISLYGENSGGHATGVVSYTAAEDGTPRSQGVDAYATFNTSGTVSFSWLAVCIN